MPMQPQRFQSETSDKTNANERDILYGDDKNLDGTVCDHEIRLNAMKCQWDLIRIDWKQNEGLFFFSIESGARAAPIFIGDSIQNERTCPSEFRPILDILSNSLGPTRMWIRFQFIRKQ